MKTLSISLPEELSSFVEAQAAARGEAAPDAYLLDLIRSEQRRQRLRDLVLAGAASPPAGEADPEFFDALRARI